MSSTGNPSRDADVRETPSKAGGLSRLALRGAVAGALGGFLFGPLGCLTGQAIKHIGFLPPNALEELEPLVILAFTLGGALAGALVGLLVGWRLGQRPAFLWPLAAVSGAALVAGVVQSQTGKLDAALVFTLGVVLLAGVFLPLVRLCIRSRAVRWLLLGWLILCLIGEGHRRLRPREFATLSPAPTEAVVQLWIAPLPGPLGAIAVHHWFNAFDPSIGRWSRWEVWQDADRRVLPGGASWGHVHKDLLSLEAGVGGAAPWVEQEWRGEPARQLLAALNRSSEYPERGRYFAMPGPNSSTYISWVLKTSGVPWDLHPLALGRDYLGTIGVDTTTTRTGVQLATPALGLKVGWLEGFEISPLGFTLGIDTWPPALKTPVGRLGYQQ